jgi:hypothetical protein
MNSVEQTLDGIAKNAPGNAFIFTIVSVALIVAERYYL